LKDDGRTAVAHMEGESRMIDLNKLAAAMQDTSREIYDYFVDVMRQELLVLHADVLDHVDEGRRIDELAPALRKEAEAAAAALKDKRRYAPVPQTTTEDAYALLEAFVRQVKDDSAMRRLGQAIATNQPFQAFAEAIRQLPGAGAEWVEFEKAQRRQWAADWLREIHVRA
jgi:hypothetical protein